MIFTQKTTADIDDEFYKLLELAGEDKEREILSRLGEAERTYSQDVIVALKWLYAHSPMSDIANYDFSLFLSFAEHGVFLRENSPFCKDVPDDIFRCYVLHGRVSSEELCDCRKFFYDLLHGRVNGMSTREAIIEANYFNAENVMYVSTDDRTLSALGTYYSAFGRCGEEAVFAVNVFRSLGIPARQVVTPRWAHCDDNHAWVEVWCEGRWHFLGACEPEEVLDKGWFTNASGRAMLIQATSFDSIPGEELAARLGMAYKYNVLNTYACTKRLTVKVTDGVKPISGVKVSFGLLNLSHIFDAAEMTTDENGKAYITCGLGSINVKIKKDGIVCEKMVYTPDADEVEMILEPQRINYDVWEDFVSIAPADGVIKGVRPTEQQKKTCAIKTAAANEKRAERVKAMFDENRANELIAKYGYGQRVRDMLYLSRGHFDDLVGFLEDEEFAPAYKERILATLTEKDMRDVRTEVLKEAMEYAAPYDDNSEIFDKYVLCPRVYLEHLSLNRKFIAEYFSEERKKLFLRSPEKIWDYIKKNIRYDGSIEYGQVTKPVGALTVKNANALSQKILFVSVCRTLGIAARMNPVTMLIEYYDGKRFVPVEMPQENDSYIVFEKGDEEYQYFADFAIAVFADGDYRDLDLSSQTWQGNTLEVPVMSGQYRVITDNRLPNGNLHSSKYTFVLGAGETKRIKLHKFAADLSEMLFDYALDDFTVKDGSGKTVYGSQLTVRPSVLMWLDEGTEPTEHILNELLEKEKEFASLPVDISFMLKGAGSLKNEKLSKVLDTFGNIKVYYDFGNTEPLARRLFLDPEKLPLIIVCDKKLNAVYACSGYNVGSGEMIVRICRTLSK